MYKYAMKRSEESERLIIALNELGILFNLEESINNVYFETTKDVDKFIKLAGYNRHGLAFTSDGGRNYYMPKPKKLENGEILIHKGSSHGKTETLKPGEGMFNGKKFYASSDVDISFGRAGLKVAESLVDYANEWVPKKLPRYKINLDTVQFINNKKRTTVVKWLDGDITAVRCSEGDTPDKTKAFLMAYFQKNSGLNKTQANKLLKEISSGKHSKIKQGEN